jgi:hypothetical protein
MVCVEGTSARSTASLRVAIARLIVSMVICCACFAVRFVMLVLKYIQLSGPDSEEASFLFGFWWWCFSDFVPRSLPMITFLVLMRQREHTGSAYLREALTQVDERGPITTPEDSAEFPIFIAISPAQRASEHTCKSEGSRTSKPRDIDERSAAK